MTALFLRDMRLGIRAGGGALVGVLFFLAVVAVIPFGVGPDLNLLARIGPAILWIGALLARGVEAFDAAGIGVRLHARAGDLVRESRGTEEGMAASDLVEAVHRAVRAELAEETGR